jgi:hypothetical protein
MFVKFIFIIIKIHFLKSHINYFFLKYDYFNFFTKLITCLNFIIIKYNLCFITNLIFIKINLNCNDYQ